MKKMYWLLSLLCSFFLCFSFTCLASNEPNKDNYITLTEMADGFSEYNLPQTKALSGRTITLYLEGDVAIKNHFIDSKTIRWETISGPEKGDKGQSEYIATNPKKDFYYVSFVTETKKYVTIILDEKKGIATLVLGHFPTEKTDNLSMFKRVMAKKPAYASSVEFINASIDKPFTKNTPIHQFSKDLIGKRALYTYSNKDAYEHIYFDNNLFTWHCISGNEKGLADTDYAVFLKLDDNYYMIVWVEKILHVISTITINFDTMRSSGSMASFEGNTYGNILNVPSGAIVKFLPGVDSKELTLSKPPKQ